MITLYFFDYDYDYNNHILWLQSRLRVIKIILEILINSSFTNFAFMRKLPSFTSFAFMRIPCVYMH